MKKYILSIFAVILAVGMVAFTTPEKRNLAATHVFEFNQALPYTIDNVTEPLNWEYKGEFPSEQLCSGSNKACRLAVTDDYVDNPSSPSELAGITISAMNSGQGKAIVTDITDSPVNGFTNQP